MLEIVARSQPGSLFSRQLRWCPSGRRIPSSHRIKDVPAARSQPASCWVQVSADFHPSSRRARRTSCLAASGMPRAASCHHPSLRHAGVTAAPAAIPVGVASLPLVACSASSAEGLRHGVAKVRVVSTNPRGVKQHRVNAGYCAPRAQMHACAHHDAGSRGSLSHMVAWASYPPA